mmetsp:Transcript_35804/g.83413  ORF Transcript_35804/g.83413 Transcript_35804/m.83413 type:complete len:148 (+) Transcript_35804:418-861(+)|eukprot:CAMPEP_0113306306 /NCGR_PEP_ID=MMETSP0010_2-20120614/5606_1 /TAXON_ID=216773 ORGANISM="Corethron hystrix, Strain 308" /NCGR_SAMPLE_ID=MMETSP0010_2 /ASSEMBLY_ACC=CAM_ASM_000155 /LENGTH=147 /DNA_ID=CAMNT_0000160939 /DNA_START=295 /DNA_END=738 /DNA_ORIENTATION=+ /assembly_acc=CAM_ASM_000155
MTFQEVVTFAKNCPDPHWNSQKQRLDDKFWPYKSFVVRLESAHEDMKKLMMRVDSTGRFWDKYGATRWGPPGGPDEEIFESLSMVKHATSIDGSAGKTHYNSIISWMVERLYVEDYEFELFGLGRMHVITAAACWLFSKFQAFVPGL